MTSPLTEQSVIDAQVQGAALTDSAQPCTLPGKPDSPIRIMFVHGIVTGHGPCTCPVVNENGVNVNPGRAPLDTKRLGQAAGARASSDVYARRAARKAADTLAVINVGLWDDETRRIVMGLATMCPASRIDDVLAETMPATDDELERIKAKLEQNDEPDMTDEQFAAENYPDMDTTDVRVAMAHELKRMDLWPEVGYVSHESAHEGETYTPPPVKRSARIIGLHVGHWPGEACNPDCAR